jgi:uncharacterized protein (DUF1499 family)
VADTWNRTSLEQRWWSKTILTGGVVAFVLLPLGALGARFGIWSFGTGFMLLVAGTMLASIVVVTGIAGIVVAKRRDLARDRPPLYVAVALAALILVLMGVQFFRASSVPPIHNVSTDVADPPQFDRVPALRGPDANPLEFDAETNAPLQQQAYPWLETLESGLPPARAVEHSAKVLEDMGLEVVNVDEAAGRVEATATTFWFGFKDDLVVRVRPAPAGSLVDVRSVSRVGRSDLGANANRIGEFLEALRTSAPTD